MPKIRALVIDDSKVMRLMVMRALNRIPEMDFEFLEAADGAEAFDLFLAKPVDIAFVDWNMPTMTGIEFVRKVREMPHAANVPLVMVTSEKTLARIDEALDRAGADAYICKPFTEEDILQKVTKVLQNKLANRKSFFERILHA